MNRKSLVMIALGALVAGALVLVYAMSNAPNRREVAFAGAARSTIPASGGNVAETAATPAAPPSETSKVLYDFNALPNPVKRMLQQIADAAQSGDIEKMRPVFESNELKPMVTTAYVDDPIAFWKKTSADGTGRDVLAAMLNVMTSGFVHKGQSKEEIFVWPYFAETDLAKLTPAQEVELYRILSPEAALQMKKAGKYSYYRLGISPTGVWQYFMQ
jgi:hypothetical protein